MRLRAWESYWLGQDLTAEAATPSAPQRGPAKRFFKVSVSENLLKVYGTEAKMLLELDSVALGEVQCFPWL